MTVSVVSQTFAVNVRAQRKATGISQRDLASAIGMSRPSVSNIEAGRQTVTLAQACAIADALKTTVAVLIDEEVVL